MSKPLADFIPSTTEDVLALAPEELGVCVLRFFVAMSVEERRDQMNRYSFSLGHNFTMFPQERQQQIAMAFMEAWIWLEREMLLAPRPGEVSGQYFFVTRRGERIAADPILQNAIASTAFPHGKLHPMIAAGVWSDFVHRDFDSAIMKAFREVEILVRAAGGFADDDLGAPLMRKAFDPERGPLTDRSLVIAEREATSHLFAGAIGLFKNPHSHRHLGVSDGDRALELLMFASYLMHHVDERARGG